MIYGGRKTCGKTTELIQLASAKFLYIVCADNDRARSIADQAKEMNMDIPYPITADELPLRGRMEEVLIDDVEEVLKKIIRRPILAMTSSRELKEANTLPKTERLETWYTVKVVNHFYTGQIGKAVKELPEGVILEIVMREDAGGTHKTFFPYEQVERTEITKKEKEEV